MNQTEREEFTKRDLHKEWSDHVNAVRKSIQDYVEWAGRVPVNETWSVGDPETAGQKWAAVITFEERE